MRNNRELPTPKNEGSENKELEQVSKVLFGEPMTRKQLADKLSIPTKNLKADIPEKSIDTFKEEPNVPAICFQVKLFDDKNRNIGDITLTFYKKDNEIVLYIDKRRLYETGQGIGLELECVLENFCRTHDIWTIKNLASSIVTEDHEKREIGAYVWAQYGYEYDQPEEILELRNKLTDFAQTRQVILPDISMLNRPIDFARLTGTDADGKSIPIGKDFLINTNVFWHGRRDLALDEHGEHSQGTKDFIAYLKQRGRKDLADKYYPNIESQHNKNT